MVATVQESFNGRVRGLLPRASYTMVGLGAIISALVVLVYKDISAPRFDGYASPQQATAHLLQSLASKSPQAAASAMVSKSQYKDLVYPSLPMSNPSWNVPADTAWQMHAMLQQKQLQRWRNMLNGRKVAVLGIDLGQPQDFGAYTLYRETAIKLRVGADRIVELKKIGSLIGCNGEFRWLSLREPADQL